MKKIRFEFLLILVAIFWSLPAGAYVLPGLHLLDLMARQMGRARALEVTQRLVLVSNQESVPSLPLQETLRYRYPNAIRLESRSENVHRIHLVVDDRAVTILDNRRMPVEHSLWDRYSDILVYRSPDLLKEQLARHGLDVMVSSLGRFQGEPCFVLGAQYPDTSVPQIWIEKETFLPIRWLIPEISSDGSRNLVEFRYLDWQKQGNVWYPMTVQFIAGETRVREIFVEHLSVNPVLDDALFDMDHFNHMYPAAGVLDPAATITEEEPSDIQKAIDDFKKRLK